jgi:hypothetical protein
MVQWVFPPGEWDGLAPAVTAKAAKQFVNHLQRLGVVVTRTATTATTTTSSSTDYDSADARMLWCNSSGFSALQQEALDIHHHPSLVLVYLHSPLHAQADACCRDFLGHASVVEFLRQPHVMAFGCSIHTGQGAQLAQWLSASSFPLVALLQPKNITTTTTNNNNNNNNNMSLVYKAEGPLLLQMIYPPPPHRNNNNNNNNNTTTIAQMMVPHWMAALQRFQSQLTEQETRRIQREQEQELRRQQDEEYQETLRQDQARQAQIQQEQDEVRQRQQEQEDAIQRQVLDEQRKLEMAQALIQDEPSVGGTRIRFVLPSGMKLDRKFYSDQTLKSLKAFLFLHFQQGTNHNNNNNQPAIVNIGLSTNFPKKTFTEEDDDKTLQEVGLAPQAALMVQDLDA